MRNIIIILTAVSFMSCAANKSLIGGYFSANNVAPWGPMEMIYLQDDSSYYKVSSGTMGKHIEGKWSVHSDTLFLEDIYDIIGAERLLIYEEPFTPWVSKYIRQGKVWCYIDDIEKIPKKYRNILKKNNHITKEYVLKWPYRFE
jgi:hypothetical protein